MHMAASDKPRYEELLQRYLQPLRRLAWSYARDGAEGDDLLQEIAVALGVALPQFRGDSSERTWVYRIAHNTGISHVTSQRRRASREPTIATHIEPASRSNPEAEAMDRQRSERLWSAIRALPVTDRQIVCLHLEGLSAAAIEEVTGISAGSVATRLTRVRQKLVVRLRGEEARA